MRATLRVPLAVAATAVERLTLFLTRAKGVGFSVGADGVAAGCTAGETAAAGAAGAVVVVVAAAVGAAADGVGVGCAAGAGVTAGAAFDSCAAGAGLVDSFCFFLGRRRFLTLLTWSANFAMMNE